MKRYLLALLVAFAVTLVGCAKTKPEAPQANSKPTLTNQDSSVEAQPTAEPQTRTAMKPVAPAKQETVAPATKSEAPAPAVNQEQKKKEEPKDVSSSPSAEKAAPPKQAPKETTPAAKPKAASPGS